MWSPGYFHVDLGPDKPASLVASTELWEVMRAVPPEEVWTWNGNAEAPCFDGLTPAAQEG